MARNFPASGAFACMVAWSLLGGCASHPAYNPELVREKELERLDSLFLDIRLSVKQGDAFKLYHTLTRDSKDWFEYMRTAARSEPYDHLINRPFFEILAVLGLRFELQRDPQFDTDPVSLLKYTVMTNHSVRKNFLQYQFGPFLLKGYSAGVGLQKAPNVPVFFFEREAGAWKFDLVRSLPLILLGAQSIARQQHAEPVEQAIFLLEQATGARFDRILLTR